MLEWKAAQSELLLKWHCCWLSPWICSLCNEHVQCHGPCRGRSCRPASRAARSGALSALGNRGEKNLTPTLLPCAILTACVRGCVFRACELVKLFPIAACFSFWWTGPHLCKPLQQSSYPIFSPYKFYFLKSPALYCLASSDPPIDRFIFLVRLFPIPKPEDQNQVA